MLRAFLVSSVGRDASDPLQLLAAPVGVLLGSGSIQGQSASPRVLQEQHSTLVILCAFASSGAGLVYRCPCGSTQGQLKLVCLVVDGKISFDELVGAALPNVEYSGSSKSAKDKDNDRQTHPTEVLRYENYNEDVKYRLQQPDVEVCNTIWLSPSQPSACPNSGLSACTVMKVLFFKVALQDTPCFTCALNLAAVPGVQVWRGKRYEKIGFAVEDYQLSEDAAVSSLCTTAGGRVNHVFKSNNMKYRFTIHPIKRRTDTQVRVNFWIVPPWHATETGASGNPP